jgi:hypothetical protein
MEALAAVIAFIYVRKWKNTIWKWFPYYLAFIVVAEYIGVHLLANRPYVRVSYYNYLVIPVEFLFFYWIFYQAFKASKYRWLPVYCSSIYITSIIIEEFYLQRGQFTFYFSFSYTVGNLLLLVLIVNYLLQLANSESVLKFKENILFWVSAGLLVYYLGSCPFYGLINLLMHKHWKLYLYYRVFCEILDSIMYLTFALGFICGNPNSSNLSSSRQ